MAMWLAGVLELEDGIALAIIKAQRLGSLAAVRKRRPRDILVQFLYQRTREKILNIKRGMTGQQNHCSIRPGTRDLTETEEAEISHIQAEQGKDPFSLVANI
ncbi:UNVERIFIED_CONTAM: hypothetical protein K2H54_061007 [Gekko kuhli]